MPQTPVIPPDYVAAVLSPAFALLPERMDSVPARVLITAIGLQESNLKFRRQKGGGPARGLYGFESGGGVHGVLRHDESRDLAASIAAARARTTSVDGVWRALERDDVLATALARLLLWTDPEPLPRLRDAEGAWRTYQEIWRPGRPRFERWAANYAAALACITGAS